MPDASRTISFPPSSQTLVSTPQTLLRLQCLLPDDAGFIYIEQNQSYLQYSFKSGGTSKEDKNSALAYYKEENVKSKVTDVVAALLHLEASGNPLAESLIVNIDDTSALTCRKLDRHKPGKPARHWEWTKDDQRLEMRDIKLRFEYALVRRERESDLESFATLK